MFAERLNSPTQADDLIALPGSMDEFTPGYIDQNELTLVNIPWGKFIHALPELIAWTSRSDESPDQVVQAVLAHGRLTRNQTWLSEEMSRLPTAWPSPSNLLLDGQIRELLGRAGQRTHRAGRRTHRAGRRTHQTGSSEQLIHAVMLAVPTAQTSHLDEFLDTHLQELLGRMV
ncbi:hypothetical protein PSTG_08546 [Puccinia striiformis f. sp. tritici PST-78]|uniref:Uncharacterized protein n=1 Tax=Puccinia striiformis f. sp. tritici PST-78 TaxID=1165861 RepID=A0A0L0VG46_9BASI|nr:hypothetical protein PSTG_08546 [Puccinia striiformis f. sp. tritici PST-78]